MKPLYEITQDHKELLKLADENEDMAQAVADTMELIEGDFNDKAISLMHVVNNMGNDVETIKKEIERLKARGKKIENRQESIKEYLRVNMDASGIKKITCPIFTITLKAGRDIVQIEDEKEIPTDYLNIKTAMIPMKKEILADLKKGIEIHGASIVKSKSSIVIK